MLPVEDELCVCCLGDGDNDTAMLSMDGVNVLKLDFKQGMAELYYAGQFGLDTQLGSIAKQDTGIHSGLSIVKGSIIKKDGKYFIAIEYRPSLILEMPLLDSNGDPITDIVAPNVAIFIFEE